MALRLLPCPLPMSSRIPVTDAPTPVAVPRGWLDLADAFYPEDLPEDWRLTYFANEFPAVLVPWQDWSGRSDEDLVGWRAEVPAGFRFWLGQPADGAQRCIATALGEGLGGWVLTDPHEDFAGGPARPAAFRCRWPDGRPAGFARIPPVSARAGPRAARTWLEGLTEPPALVILPCPTSTDLAHWRDLLWMYQPPGRSAA